MMTAIRNAVLKRGVQHLFVALLAVAVLAAGAGIGHSATQAGGQAHHAQAAAPDHHGDASAKSDHQKCHDQTPAQEQAPSPSQYDMGGCCVNACFAPALPRDVQNVTPSDFDIQTLYPGADQAPALTAPAGLFRPPRDRA